MEAVAMVLYYLRNNGLKKTNALVFMLKSKF